MGCDPKENLGLLATRNPDAKQSPVKRHLYRFITSVAVAFDRYMVSFSCTYNNHAQLYKHFPAFFHHSGILCNLMSKRLVNSLSRRMNEEYDAKMLDLVSY